MFDSSHYGVQQKVPISNKYIVYEGDNPVLSAKQRKFKLKEDFRLNDHDTGEEHFRVKADSALDVSVTYDIVDSRTDECVGAAERGAFLFTEHTYQLLGSDGLVVGQIAEDSILMVVARWLVTTFIPFSYRIKDVAGEEVDAIDGRFSLRDRYTVDANREHTDPRLAVVGVAVVDVIKEN